jgi:hypothetical protein
MTEHGVKIEEDGHGLRVEAVPDMSRHARQRVGSAMLQEAIGKWKLSKQQAKRDRKRRTARERKRRKAAKNGR